jgi:hypothetical protein
VAASIAAAGLSLARSNLRLHISNHKADSARPDSQPFGFRIRIVETLCGALTALRMPSIHRARIAVRLQVERIDDPTFCYAFY